MTTLTITALVLALMALAIAYVKNDDRHEADKLRLGEANAALGRENRDLRRMVVSLAKRKANRWRTAERIRNLRLLHQIHQAYMNDAEADEEEVGGQRWRDQ